MLHIITNSSFASSTTNDCLAVSKHDDVILLIGDAVYTLEGTTDLSKKTIYAINEDIKIRGLSPKAGITYIDYLDMVKLTETHHPIQTWS